MFLFLHKRGWMYFTKPHPPKWTGKREFSLLDKALKSTNTLSIFSRKNITPIHNAWPTAWNRPQLPVLASLIEPTCPRSILELHSCCWEVSDDDKKKPQHPVLTGLHLLKFNHKLKCIQQHRLSVHAWTDHDCLQWLQSYICTWHMHIRTCSTYM